MYATSTSLDQAIQCDTTLRNDFHALIHIPSWVRDLTKAAEQAGVYTPGIVSNRRCTRGESINVDVYGYDVAQQLAVIQVRQCRFQDRFHKVRKDYYLLGRVEDRSVFAHPVETPARSKKALTTPETCVQWVLAKIWDCPIADLPEIRRQGDIAFVPVTLPKTAHPLVVQTLTIRETHVITAARIWQDGCAYYVSRRAKAIHTKREHAPVQVRHGIFRVQPGIRAKVWGFATPCGD